MSNTGKIIGLILTFCACGVVGYFLPITVSSSGGATQAESAIGQPPQAEMISETTENPTVTAPTVVDTLSSCPYNIQVVHQQNAKLGYVVSVTASVDTNDELECVIKINETATNVVARQTMAQGKCYFQHVLPVDGGSYYVGVRNVATGEMAGVVKSGFHKMVKWSAAKLTEQLNATHVDKQFFAHFDTEKLRFDCEGIDPSQAPKSLDRLRNARSAQGWSFVVSETPQYDQYNRIVYFKINVISE